MQYYMSWGTTVGVGANATINAGLIFPFQDKNPQLDNWNGSSVNGGVAITGALGAQGGASQDGSYAYGGLSLGLGAKWNKRVGGGQGNTILLGSPTYIGSPSNISSNNCFGGYVPY